MELEFVSLGDGIIQPYDKIRIMDYQAILEQMKVKDPAFTAAWFSDFHAWHSGPKGDYCTARIPALLAAINSHDYDVVLESGDCFEGIAGGEGEGTFAQQVAKYNSFVSGLTAPKYTILGNHDVLGTGFTHEAARIACGMPSLYYYQDFPGNWRIVFLFSNATSVHPAATPFDLGATQRTWLSDLIAVSQDKNVCLITHVPIHGVAAPGWWAFQTAANPITAGAYNLTFEHRDIYPLLDMIRLNPCIKICLSGHEHAYDECKYFQCWFMNGGSAAGNYWNPENHWHHQYAGYNILKFYADGTYNREIFLY